MGSSSQLAALRLRAAWETVFPSTGRPSEHPVLPECSIAASLHLESSNLLSACAVGDWDKETVKRLKKQTLGRDNLEVAGLLCESGISTRASYIIGFPGEDEESMLDTLREALEMAVHFPTSAPTVWPFQPIPGSAMYAEALRAGFQPPTSLDDWGSFLHFKPARAGSNAGGGGGSPELLARLLKLYEHFVYWPTDTARGEFGF